MAIADGRVTVAGAPAEKAARLVAPGEAVLVTAATREWASRGGHKLVAALDRWEVVVAGRRCLDAGASTGGFTDVLLSRGAAEVWAVDVGRGQLHERLRRNERVVARDRTNVRLVTLADLGGTAFALVVADLSFISLRTVAENLAANMASPGADLVWLVKPQFEAGKATATAARGVIRDPAVWREALSAVGRAVESAGAAIMGAMASPLRGAEGNVEFLLWAQAHRGTGGRPLDDVVGEAMAEVEP